MESWSHGVNISNSYIMPEMAYISDMIKRIIRLPKHSFFLFGARGVGKSTLIKETIIIKNKKKVLFIDLLSAEDEELFLRKQDLLYDVLHADPKKYTFVIIDEI